MNRKAKKRRNENRANPIQDRKGSVSVELALLLLPLVITCFATFDICQYIFYTAKVQRIAATVVSLAAHERVIIDQVDPNVPASVGMFFRIGEEVSMPIGFNGANRDSSIVLTSIRNPTGARNREQINWQRRGGGQLTFPSRVGAGTGASAKLPATEPRIVVGPDDEVLVAEAAYRFTPVSFVTTMIGLDDFIIEAAAYQQPRYANQVRLSSNPEKTEPFRPPPGPTIPCNCSSPTGPVWHVD